ARQRRKRAGTPGAARRKSVVAMLGPAAPQIGGMVTAIDLLMSSPLAEQYTLLRCATPAPRSAQPAGAAARSASRGRAVARHALALARWAALLAHARAAVAHIHTCSGLTLYRNLLDLLVAKLLGRRVVLHIRGGQFADFCRCAGPLGRWLIQAGCAAADAVIVLSEHWRRALAPHLPGSRIHVIPNGVAAGAWAERDQSPKGLPSGILHCRPGHAPCRFLYLAALTEAKGLGDLLDAAGQLAAEGVPFELAIAGPESTTGAAGDLPRSAWRQRVARLGLGGRVRFVGPVTGAAKERLLAGADCFVHPSHSEAMPNVVLEAGAAGLPVIATAVGSLPEVLRPNHAGPPLACLLPPHDQPALSAALRSMANDPELRRAMGRALQRHIRANYDIAITAARLGRIYAALLEARPPEDGRRVEAGVSPADAERTSQCSATPRGAQTAPRAPREARGRSCVLAAAEEQAP
ncbi:MAG: glycosyltransferase family 4 protein, partial [Planctomycetota bacterium]